MRLYLLWSFWVGVIGVAARLGFLGWAEYPRNVTYSRGEDVVLLSISVGFLVWASWLLWS